MALTSPSTLHALYEDTDFSPEAPVADFPETELLPIRASVDIDSNGNGIYRLEKPISCSCCRDTVFLASAHTTDIEEYVLTCRGCLHELGILEVA